MGHPAGHLYWDLYVIDILYDDMIAQTLKFETRQSSKFETRREMILLVVHSTFLGV